MDTVIFTGVQPYRDYKLDRPEAVKSLKESGKLRKHVVTMRISRRRAIAIRVFGYTALGIGLALVGLIIYSVLFGYQ